MKTNLNGRNYMPYYVTTATGRLLSSSRSPPTIEAFTSREPTALSALRSETSISFKTSKFNTPPSDTDKVSSYAVRNLSKTTHS